MSEEAAREQAIARISKHLSAIVQQQQLHLEQPPHSYDALAIQRVAVDAALSVALEVICEVLPPELQPQVKRLLEVYEAIWQRGIEIDEGGEGERQ